MIRPLDLQVAWNAVPNHASALLQQQATEMYRFTQALSDSHKKNLERNLSVTQVSEGKAGFLHTLQKMHTHNYRFAEMQEYYKNRKFFENKLAIYKPHSVLAKKYRNAGNMGEFFNLHA